METLSRQRPTIIQKSYGRVGQTGWRRMVVSSVSVRPPQTCVSTAAASFAERVDCQHINYCSHVFRIGSDLTSWMCNKRVTVSMR